MHKPGKERRRRWILSAGLLLGSLWLGLTFLTVNATEPVRLMDRSQPARVESGTGQSQEGEPWLGPYPQPEITINDVTVTEGNGGIVQAIFSLLRSGYLGAPSSVEYATGDGTAAQPADYSAASGTLFFAADETTRTITIEVQGDIMDENNENFYVNLSNPGSAVLIDNQGIGTISDDDPLPVLSISDVTVTDGYTTNVSASFSVSLNNLSGKIVTVNYATQNDSATAPADYLSKTGTLIFPPGQSSLPIDVTVVGSLTPERAERFFVNLSIATNAMLGDSQGTGTILKFIQALPVIFKD